MTWEQFAQYSIIGVVSGVSLGFFCLSFAFFIARFRSSIRSVCSGYDS